MMFRAFDLKFLKKYSKKCSTAANAYAVNVIAGLLVSLQVYVTYPKQAVFTAVSYKTAQNCPSGWGFASSPQTSLSLRELMGMTPPDPTPLKLLSTHVHKICCN